MREPALVGACMAAMKNAAAVPVTVKSRIGVDDQDPEVSLRALIASCADAGVTRFTIHARKAWLEGLSPKENRDVPPLDYALVYRIKAENPHLTIAINGGIETLEQAKEHLAHVDGVMLGRAAYQNPALLAEVDAHIFGGDAVDLDAAVETYCRHVEQALANGMRLHTLVKPMLGLFNGRPGARLFRRHLSENAVREGAGISVLRDALAMVQSRKEAA
jgi:tRNA-dihydrouridine synthase A